MSATEKKIFVAGHRGMVGAAIVRALEREGAGEIIVRTREQLDLANQAAVQTFFQTVRPTEVYLAAAKVGGILANDTYRGDFIYENLMIEANVIRAAFDAGVEKLLFLGSSCIYPRLAEQPIREDSLLTGPLEPTNEPYAIAKIAGIALCDGFNRQYGVDYRSVMPTNLYGPGDNYHPVNSHVIPALIRRFQEAKETSAPSVTIWGSGKPLREFLFVDDMAEACLQIMSLDRAAFDEHARINRGVVNVGYGSDMTIAELATVIADVVGYAGNIDFDRTKPDGTPRKLMDSSVANALGWKPVTDIRTGLALAYEDFRQAASVRK